MLTTFPCPNCTKIIAMDTSQHNKCPECGATLAMGTKGADRGRAVVIAPPPGASDPNRNAARIVAESTRADKPLPPDLEAAWEAWSKGIQKVDERARSLLRAAFEAGAEAAARARPSR